MRNHIIVLPQVWVQRFGKGWEEDMLKAQPSASIIRFFENMFPKFSNDDLETHKTKKPRI